MDSITLTDDYGRRTVFTGEKLVDEHSDTSDGRKPHWVEIGVWRTEAGNYVVSRTTCYRIRHLDPGCDRLEGYGRTKPTSDDTFPCRSCNPDGVLEGGYAQTDRISVDAYGTPQELIESFRTDGRYSNLARAILSELSERDEAIDSLWNTVVVP